MNKQCFTVTGATESEYKQWCRANHKRRTYPSTRREFFKQMLDAKLQTSVKESNDNDND